ncbi:MAG: bifunctional diguanylate cyclase/phosphodiesterase [Actinomycetota bacterium]|nr:bifunctional diguanylate cyclase/phosphodiesterase [Actinomycetota bacterium]
MSVFGLAVLIWTALNRSNESPRNGKEWLTLTLFTFFIVLGELRPIKVSRGEDKEEITTSTTFAFALLLSSGTALAILVQAGACMVAEMILYRRQGQWWKSLFNVAQLTLALAGSGALLSLFSLPRSGAHAFEVGDLGAILAAGVVFFVINNGLAGMGLALSLDIPVLAYLRRDLGFQMWTASMMLALAPVVVVTTERNPWLVFLLALPLVGIYWGSHQAVLNEHQALHDSLTGLPNRILLRDRVQQAILNCQRDKCGLAVMIMDLDRFKEINDTLGHHNGDLLLKRIGPRLRACLRQSDAVARLGGDEFAVLLRKLDDGSTATQVAAKLRKSFEHPFDLQGLSLNVEPSIGIALYPDHGADADVLLQHADVAMYIAKENRSGFTTYVAEQDQYSAKRLALAGELRRALDDRREEELLLYYQPKAELNSGRVVGVEALLRWLHPRHALMLPDDFIPVAEHTGLIRPLTLYAIDAALEQLRRWQGVCPDLTVAINLSVRNLLDRHLQDDVARLLEKWVIAPHRLRLEITESVIMTDTKRSLAALAALHEMGVRLSVDDFGTGHSSLTYLKQLPVSEIKIDKSFIMNMSATSNDAVIVRSTIDLGRNLGMQVVAEGVESEVIWNQLSLLGCDLAQGHYVTRALSAQDMTEWLGHGGQAIGASRLLPRPVVGPLWLDPDPSPRL